jgi:hypothetical protein
LSRSLKVFISFLIFFDVSFAQPIHFVLIQALLVISLIILTLLQIFWRLLLLFKIQTRGTSFLEKLVF